MLNIPMYSLVLEGGGEDVDMPSDCQNLGGGRGTGISIPCYSLRSLHLKIHQMALKSSAPNMSISAASSRPTYRYSYTHGPESFGMSAMSHLLQQSKG